MPSIIINFCPTGMVPTKKMTPHVPVSVNEIIEEVHEAWEIGITIAHLHARLDDEQPTYLNKVYQPIFEGIRKHCPGLIICGSSSGRNYNEFEKRSEVIELRPDMCSLTLSSLNFMEQASVNAPDMIQKLAAKMKEYGVTPELECFDLGMINYGKFLIRKGLIEAPCYWNLLFGNIAGFQPTLHAMGLAVEEIPKGHYFALGGLGASQLVVNAIAIAAGYGVRIGLEDNIWYDQKRTRLATNKDLLLRVHELITINEQEFMTASALGEQNFYNETALARV
jgi:uncharacterized protein (DUF849 family)